MKTSTLIWTIVIIIVLGGGAWYWYANSAATATPATTQNPNGADVTGGVTSPKTVTVLYGPNGFSPATVTINKGDTVTFTNNGGGAMWVASNPHPTHEGYDGTTRDVHCAAGYTGAPPLDQCATGTTFSFMFNQTGTWGYHNHNDHAMTGTVIVQ